jgi:SM-20-related protein
MEAMASEPTSRAAATPVDCYVIDGLLAPEHQRHIDDYLRHGAWDFGWKSARKVDKYSFWHRHFAGHRNASNETQYPCARELEGSAPLIFALWQQLAATVLEGHTLIRCYANAHTYGSDGTLHTDSKSPHSYTSIYYSHPRWVPNWAGETVIFDADKSDIIAAIHPRPNRLAVFRGVLPHVARGVSRTCPELRITLMFKTMEQE